MAGGSGAFATGSGSGFASGCGFASRGGRAALRGGGSALATLLSGAALPPTTNALAADPYVEGPFPRRSLASIQYSLCGLPGKLTRKVSSSSLFTIGDASTRPPGVRWWQIAERTPVSSVMRASTWTWLPRTPARTSEICGGLVSSARAPAARHSAPNPARMVVRMRGDYRARAGGIKSAGSGGGRGPLVRELDGDDLGDARLLHRHPVQRVGHLHGALVMGDHDELGGAAHLAHDLVVPADVRLVERRVHFVEQAEGSGLDEEDGEEQRDRRQRLLPAGEQVHRGQLLARRLGHDLHSRLGRGVGRVLHQLQLRLAAAEQARKDLLEALVDQQEGLLEPLLRDPVDAGDGGTQLGDGFLQVRLLAGEDGVALADLAGLVDGRQRDLAQRLDLLPQGMHLLIGLGNVELQRRLPARGRDVGQLHQIALAHLLLEVRHFQPGALERQLRLAAALSDGASLLARLAHLLVPAAEPLLRLVVAGARADQLVAKPLGVGEQRAQLLLLHLAFGLERGVPLLPLRDLGPQLLAAGLDLRPLLLEAVQRPGHSLAALGH